MHQLLLLPQTILLTIIFITPLEINASAMGPNIFVRQPSGLRLSNSIIAWGDNSMGQRDVPVGFTDTQAIAAGGNHTVILRSDGTIISWGSNSRGQASVPYGLKSVLAIAAGIEHTMALKRDGTIVAWGSNYYGQIDTPISLNGIQAIAAGGHHSVALKNDGTVVAWGGNEWGQASVPTGLTGVQAISAGYSHTVALKNDGTVVAWGENNSGQASVPTGLTGVQAVSAGYSHTVALKRDGTIIVWGANDYGRLNAPSGLSGIKAVAAGNNHIVAVKNDGTVVAWGDNSNGQTNVPIGLSGVQAIAAGGNHSLIIASPKMDLGSTILGTRSAEMRFTIKNKGSAPLLITSVSVSGGNASEFHVSMAGMHTSLPEINSETTFTVTFTPDALGQRSTTLRIVSNDPNKSSYDLPMIGTGVVLEIAVMSNAKEIINGDTTPSISDNTDFGAVDLTATPLTRTFSIKNSGNTNLIINDRAITIRGMNTTDFTIGGIIFPTSIAASSSTTFNVIFDPSAIGQRTATVSIANNDSDENPFNFSIRGTGTAAPEISVVDSAGKPISGTVVAWGGNRYRQTNVPTGLTDVQAITAGEDQTVALKNDGTVIAWSSFFPSQMAVPAGLTNVQAIAAGQDYTLALKSDSTVVAWSDFFFGQLKTPIGLTGVKAIASGVYNSIALKHDGSVVAWENMFSYYNQISVPIGLTGIQAIAAGYNQAVALKNDGTVGLWGYGDYRLTNGPVGLNGVQAIAAGFGHNVALKSDGTVVAWGYNHEGQTNVPIGLTGVQAVAAGGQHTLALKSDGTVVAWGDNSKGQTSVPTGLNGVRTISANFDQSFAILKPSVDFEVPSVGTASVTKTFTIKNIGSAPLNLTNVSLIGGNAADFRVQTSRMLTTVPANHGQTTFTVTFTPSATGIKTTTLRIASNDADEATFDIHLKTTVAEILVSNRNSYLTDGASLDLGDITVNAPRPVSFTILNDGNGPLHIVSMKLTGTNANQFKLINTSDAIVPPQGKTTFTIQALLTSLGNKTATLHIVSNDADESSFDISLNAVGGVVSLPVIVTEGASQINASSLDLRTSIYGMIDTKGLDCDLFFEYGKTAAYGNKIPAFKIFSFDLTQEPIYAQILGRNLLPHTTYHYRALAESSHGVAFGADKTFTIPNRMPIGKDDNANALPLSSVILDVLKNDIDADKDPLFIRSISAVTPASAGTVGIRGNKIVFKASATLGADTSTPISFNYTLSDNYKDGTASATVIINSSKCLLEPMSQALTSAGTTYPIDVTAWDDAAWTVTESLSWVTVSSTQGIGEATVQVTVQSNTSSKSRTGVLTIGGINHTITQAGIKAAPEVSAAVLTGTTTTGPFDTIVGARDFSVSVPCTNLPATFTVASGTLPPGLKLDAVKGTISGIPTIGHSGAVSMKAYPLTIQAANFQGSSTTPIFTIMVEPLPKGIIGLYHGYITPSATARLTAHPYLGGRFEMTATSTGAFTGQIYEGTCKKSFAGILATTVAMKQNPTLNTHITGTEYMLNLTLDAKTNGLSGTMTDMVSGTPINAWRNTWRTIPPANKAMHFLGQNNVFIQNTDPLSGPQGYGYASFSVNEATGGYTLVGKLADETKTTATLITNSFIGQQGQMLFYLPLYSNRGSCSGVFTLDPAITGNNQTQGTLTWIKAPSPAAAKDSTYAEGFGPLLLNVKGNRYVPPALGQLVLNATTSTANNATLSYYDGGLSGDFLQALLIKNPSPTGLTNTATLPTFNNSLSLNPNPNKVTLTLSAASGLFRGSFTLPTSPPRVAPYYGIITRDITPNSDTLKGYGYFLLPNASDQGPNAQVNSWHATESFLSAHPKQEQGVNKQSWFNAQKLRPSEQRKGISVIPTPKQSGRVILTAP